MTRFWANMFSVAFPWLVALIFIPGTAIGDLINWSSAVCFVALNFCLPLGAYVRMSSQEGREALLAEMKKEGVLTVADRADGGEGAASGGSASAAGASASLNSGSALPPWLAGRSLAFSPSKGAPPALGLESDDASASLLSRALDDGSGDGGDGGASGAISTNPDD
jgi:hypothetical protein